MLTPQSIKRLSEGAQGTALELVWSDGLQNTLTSEKLRKSCPCAVCKEKRGDQSHQKPLTSGRALLNVISSTIDEECNLEKVWLVGNYALGIRWADGHDSGIYTYTFLRELSTATEE